jgi:outer membrane lipoprotein SlyB
MNIPTGPYRGRLMQRVGGLLFAIAVAPAGAQYIQIPDFRNAPPAPAAASRPAESCSNCGVIRSIREIQSQRSTAVPQVFQNSQMSTGPDSTVRVGAVVALPLGDSSTDQSFVGGVGTPEMRARFSDSSYEITVLLDNGAYSVVQRRDGGRYRVGDRVRMRGIELELLNP